MNLIEFTGEELQAELDRRRLERMLKGVEDTDLETELTKRTIKKVTIPLEWLSGKTKE